MKISWPWGIVGFFVIPIVGLVVGFLAGVFVSEAVRLGTVKGAWPTTMQAMKRIRCIPCTIAFAKNALRVGTKC